MRFPFSWQKKIVSCENVYSILESELAVVAFSSNFCLHDGQHILFTILQVVNGIDLGTLTSNIAKADFEVTVLGYRISCRNVKIFDCRVSNVESFLKYGKLITRCN